MATLKPSGQLSYAAPRRFRGPASDWNLRMVIFWTSIGSDPQEKRRTWPFFRMAWKAVRDVITWPEWPVP